MAEWQYSGKTDPSFGNQMLNAGLPQYSKGPELAFYADKSGLDRFSKAGFTRSDNEKSLDYTSVEDGSNRFFISDKDMKIVDQNANKLGDRVKHDKMYAAYPDIKNTNVTYRKNTGSEGHYDTMGKDLNFDYNPQNPSPFGKEKTGALALHEMQHLINDKVGWNNGYGNLAWVQENPELYWNSGNEAQSYFVENMYRDGNVAHNGNRYNETLGHYGSKGAINTMRDFMESKTGNRLFYEEKMTPQKQKIIDEQKRIDDFWENGPQ